MSNLVKIVAIAALTVVSTISIMNENKQPLTNPRYLDSRGAYNVPQCNDDNAAAFCEPFLRKGELKPVKFEELDSINNLIMDVKSRLNIVDDGLYMNGNLEDRTFFLCPRIAEDLTKSFLEELQSQVLQRYPLWRIVITCGGESQFIVVYDSSIRLPVGVDSIDDHIANVQQRILREEEKVNDDKERQLSKVASLISKYRVLTQPFFPRAIASFDSWRGDKESITVWLLQEGYAFQNKSWIPTQPEDAGKGYRGADGSYDVNQDGSLMEFLTAPEPIGAVVCYVFRRSEFDGFIKLINPSTQEETICSLDSLLLPR